MITVCTPTQNTELNTIIINPFRFLIIWLASMGPPILDRLTDAVTSLFFFFLYNLSICLIKRAVCECQLNSSRDAHQSELVQSEIDTCLGQGKKIKKYGFSLSLRLHHGHRLSGHRRNRPCPPSPSADQGAINSIFDTKFSTMVAQRVPFLHLEQSRSLSLSGVPHPLSTLRVPSGEFPSLSPLSSSPSAQRRRDRSRAMVTSRYGTVKLWPRQTWWVVSRIWNRGAMAATDLGAMTMSRSGASAATNWERDRYDGELPDLVKPLTEASTKTPNF